MLCRKCNYILTGKENFCPNCGTMPFNMAPPFPEAKSKEAEPPSVLPKEYPKRATDKSIEFTFPKEAETEVSKEEELNIFSAAEKDEIEEHEEKKKKSPAGKILILLFICCTLAVAAFGIADYMGLTPVFSRFVQTFSGEANTTSQPEAQAFSHNSTVLEPEINYPMTTAYIFSGNGLSLRKGPGNGYSPLYSLTDLTKVQIFGGSLANTNWLYVYCPEKESYGWLDGSFLCSEAVAQNKLTQQYASVEDIPTNYYYEE